MKFSATATAFALIALSTVSAKSQEHDLDRGPVRHVLLLSIDGMHAVDFANCAHGVSSINQGSPYCPHLAALGKTGVNYVAASTSKPSDSFPGLTAITTGGTPRTTGVYYDVAFDRSLSAPALTTGNGVAAGPCTPYGTPTGTTTEYEEGVDIDQSKLNGGAPGAGLTEGGVASIDTRKLPRDPKTGCKPVMPWDFVRVNSVFSVIHQAGGYTAWSDKHPVYSSVAGPGGLGLNDFYAPEINSKVVALPGVKTPLGISCSTVPDLTQVGSWTDSFQNVQCYDTLKVNAILNQAGGKTHNGGKAIVPAIFGMNFQAVSVAQKLIEKNVGTGGYTDSTGTPSAGLLSAIEFVDASIGEMVQALKDSGRYEQTLIIVTAKHGQSPIDPKSFFPIPGPSGTNGVTPADLLCDLLPYSESAMNPTGIGPTQDDVSIIWLSEPGNLDAAVQRLENDKAQLGLGQILSGEALALLYNKPGVGPGLDPRTPDIIGIPNYGVVYTGSSKKLSEHGGFSHDDTNVILLLSNPFVKNETVHIAVETAQIAPTILRALGLDPNKLDAVRAEGTAILPGLSQYIQP